MPERVNQYRLNAQKCFELALKSKDPDARRSLHLMADAWLMLHAVGTRWPCTARTPPMTIAPCGTATNAKSAVLSSSRAINAISFLPIALRDRFSVHLRVF
jgi:hypothetical protein